MDAQTPDRLRWERTTVDDRPAIYGVAGDGAPLVFLHGWGLSHRTYRSVLKRLVGRGIKVYAPALPGFGNTASLSDDAFSLAGYARWVDGFIAAVGIEEPVTLVGHSFGGGVAIKTAHDHPKRVARLVLVNSIGGSVWTHRGDTMKTMKERPLWDWGLHFPADAMSFHTLARVIPVIAADALPNAARRPRTMWHVGRLARDADLTKELARLKRRRLPVVILWGRDDKVLPMAAADSLAIALGSPEVVTVEGSHGWLLADPGRFAELITNIVGLPSGKEGGLAS
jgi:pimeloyl-ACP methyl ester carboxylesterase